MLLAASVLADSGCVSASLAQIVRGSKQDADFQLQPVGAPGPRFRLGSAAAGKVIRAAASARARARFRVLGILRVRAGDAQPFRRRRAARVSLARTAAFGSFYFGFAAVFAVAVAISIAGLAFRRFVVRPRWLGAAVVSNPASSRC